MKWKVVEIEFPENILPLPWDYYLYIATLQF